MFCLLQGMGNFVNGCVILIVMSFYNMTGPTLDPIKSRNTIMIQFAVGAAVSVFLVLWRYFKLQESKVRRPVKPHTLFAVSLLFVSYFSLLWEQK